MSKKDYIYIYETICIIYDKLQLMNCFILTKNQLIFSSNRDTKTQHQPPPDKTHSKLSSIHSFHEAQITFSDPSVSFSNPVFFMLFIIISTQKRKNKTLWNSILLFFFSFFFFLCSYNHKSQDML